MFSNSNVFTTTQFTLVLIEVEIRNTNKQVSAISNTIDVFDSQISEIFGLLDNVINIGNIDFDKIINDIITLQNSVMSIGGDITTIQNNIQTNVYDISQLNTKLSSFITQVNNNLLSIESNFDIVDHDIMSLSSSLNNILTSLIQFECKTISTFIIAR